mmetsp:Transcript_2010/g.4530  ORF Transcript_2010/g.4530 Transcript_2010/m.4530 type:complete len:509 (-) Transcript_2010:96-1622(-)
MYFVFGLHKIRGTKMCKKTRFFLLFLLTLLGRVLRCGGLCAFRTLLAGLHLSIVACLIVRGIIIVCCLIVVSLLFVLVVAVILIIHLVHLHSLSVSCGDGISSTLLLFGPHGCFALGTCRCGIHLDKDVSACRCLGDITVGLVITARVLTEGTPVLVTRVQARIKTELRVDLEQSGVNSNLSHAPRVVRLSALNGEQHPTLFSQNRVDTLKNLGKELTMHSVVLLGVGLSASKVREVEDHAVEAHTFCQVLLLLASLGLSLSLSILILISISIFVFLGPAICECRCLRLAKIRKRAYKPLALHELCGINAGVHGYSRGLDLSHDVLYIRILLYEVLFTIIASGYHLKANEVLHIASIVNSVVAVFIVFLLLLLPHPHERSCEREVSLSNQQSAQMRSKQIAALLSFGLHPLGSLACLRELFLLHALLLFRRLFHELLAPRSQLYALAACACHAAATHLAGGLQKLPRYLLNRWSARLRLRHQETLSRQVRQCTAVCSLPRKPFKVSAW